MIPPLSEAMKIFNKHSKIHLKDIKKFLVASKVFHIEENCALLPQPEDDLQWPWLAGEMAMDV